MLLGGFQEQGWVSDEGAGLGKGQCFGFMLVSLPQKHLRGGPGCWPETPALCLPLHFSLDAAAEELPLSGACKVWSCAHQVFSFPGSPSHGERVTPHWLLRGRTRRAVNLDEKVRAETVPLVCAARLGPAPRGLHGGTRMEMLSLEVP